MNETRKVLVFPSRGQKPADPTWTREQVLRAAAVMLASYGSHATAIGKAEDIEMQFGDASFRAAVRAELQRQAAAFLVR